MRRPSGSALVLALLLTVVLFLMGTGYLYFIERDYRFAGFQERSGQAWYLAQAGLEYHRARPGAFTPGVPVRRSLPEGDPSRYFEVTLRPDGTVIARGVVEGTLAGFSAGDPPRVERVVVLPGGISDEAYDESQE